MHEFREKIGAPSGTYDLDQAGPSASSAPRRRLASRRIFRRADRKVGRVCWAVVARLRGQGRPDLIGAPGAGGGGDDSPRRSRQDVADPAFFQLSRQS